MIDEAIYRVRARNDEYGFTFDAVSDPDTWARALVHDVFRYLVGRATEDASFNPYRGLKITMQITRIADPVEVDD